MPKRKDYTDAQIRIIQYALGEARKDLQIGNEGLAELLGIKYQTLNNYLRKDMPISPPKASIYAFALLSPNCFKRLEEGRLLGSNNDLTKKIKSIHTMNAIEEMCPEYPNISVEDFIDFYKSFKTGKMEYKLGLCLVPKED